MKALIYGNTRHDSTTRSSRDSDIHFNMAQSTAYSSPTDTLFDAVRRDDYITVDTILDTHPQLTNTWTTTNDNDDKSLTPLLQASWAGSTQVVNALLKKGAEVSATGKLSMTKQSKCEIYRSLGGYGGMHGTFPLYVAALRGHSDIVRRILESGADVNQKTDGGQTVLHAACFLGELDEIWSVDNSSVLYVVKHTPIDDFTLIIIHLIEQGADINIRDNCGQTPLHLACRYGGPELVQFLIEKGADASVKDNYGYSVLEISALYEPASMEVLLEHQIWMEEDVINAYEVTGDLDYMTAATLKRDEMNIQKKTSEPQEDYKFANEWKTLEQIEYHGDDYEWTWLQSRLARERVFNGRYIHFECDFTEPDDAMTRSQEISVLARHCIELCKKNNDYLYFVSLSSATGQLLYELTMERELDALETGTIMELIGLAMESAIKMREVLERERQIGNIEDLICQLERTLEVTGDLFSVLLERGRMSLHRASENGETKDFNDKMNHDFIESNLKRLMYKVPCVRSTITGYRKQLLHILISKKYEATIWNYYLRLPDPEVVRTLLKLRHDINSTDSEGNTLLHIVVNLFSAQKDLFARESSPDAILKITTLLLESGNDIHAKNKQKLTALNLIENCTHYKKASDTDMQNCIMLIQQYEMFPTLKHLVVQKLHKSGIAYHKYLPDALTAYVDQH